MGEAESVRQSVDGSKSYGGMLFDNPTERLTVYREGTDCAPGGGGLPILLGTVPCQGAKVVSRGEHVDKGEVPGFGRAKELHDSQGNEVEPLRRLSLPENRLTGFESLIHELLVYLVDIAFRELPKERILPYELPSQTGGTSVMGDVRRNDRGMSATAHSSTLGQRAEGGKGAGSLKLATLTTGTRRAIVAQSSRPERRKHNG